MADDIDKLIAWACSQGWTVTVDANGYRRFHTPAGSYVTRGPTVSKWIARVTVATSAPLEEQHLDALDEAAERWDATIANRADGPVSR